MRIIIRYIVLFLCVQILPFSILRASGKNKNPVFLVHGFCDDDSKMKHIAKSLLTEGYTVYSTKLEPSAGQLGIDDLALQLNDFIKSNVKDEQRIDLVGFSMGGLICRYYLQKLNGLCRTDHFISISTPHHGTITAFTLWNKGALQMRYNSAFLLDLNNDLDKLNTLHFLSIWTPFDLMIVPASSSHVAVGCEKKVNCILHPLMVSDKYCINAIKCELLK